MWVCGCVCGVFGCVCVCGVCVCVWCVWVCVCPGPLELGTSVGLYMNDIQKAALEVT